jgi:two-component SAPR family response regulator
MNNNPLIFVDDDVDDLALMKEMAVAIYFPNEVITFHRPETALEYLQSMNISPLFILSDISMPGMNGWELRNRTMSINPFVTSAPFIFLSSSKTNEEVSRAVGLNVWGYYKKPNSLGGMREVLENIRSSLNDTYNY